MMTLGDLKTFFATGTVNQALRAPGSATMGQIVHWVVTDILATADFWWNKGEDTFDTIDGQAQYFLSNRVFMDKIWGMFDEDNDNPIEKKDQDWIYAQDPTPTEEGDPCVWAYVDQATCQAVPTAAGVMTVVGSNATDTGIDIVLKGKSSGIEQYEILTSNGTTTVTGSVSWDASEPVAINLEAKAQGLMTISRGVVMAQIPPGHLRVIRPRIRLYQVPGTTGDTLRYFYYKRSVPLVSDADIVDLPDPAFRALRYGIEEIAYFLVGKSTQSESAFQKYDRALNGLVNISERDIAGNEIKDYRRPTPFGFRLPDTINYTVT